MDKVRTRITRPVVGDLDKVHIARNRYTFDGVNQYVTHAAWSPLGDPDVYATVSYATDNEDGYVDNDPVTFPISEFGRVGANYHSGTIYNRLYRDTSPVQDVDVVLGNGSRTGTLPDTPYNLTSATFGYVHKSTNQTILSGKTDPSATEAAVLTTVSNVLTAGQGVTAITVDGTAYNDSALTDGQHYLVTLTLSGTNLTTVGPLVTGSAIAELELTAEVTLEFLLTEGSGTTINNTNDTSKTMRNFVNVQTQSNNPVGTGSITPPLERVGVQYFSGGETGAIQGTGTEDRWNQQSHPDHISEAFVVGGVADGFPVREGSKSIKCCYYKSWGYWGTTGTKIRSELLCPDAHKMEVGKEYWLGFSIYVKDNANNQSWVNNNRSNQKVMQHRQPGITGGSGLEIREGKFEYEFGQYSGSQFADAILGEWVDFVINVKLSTGSDGFCKLWMNAASDVETPVYSKTGKSIATGVTEMSWRVGTYFGDIDSPATYIECFYDEHRIGNAEDGANFNSVKPGS